MRGSISPSPETCLRRRSFAQPNQDLCALSIINNVKTNVLVKLTMKTDIFTFERVSVSEAFGRKSATLTVACLREGFFYFLETLVDDRR